MRGLVPRLGRGAWVVLAADLLSAVGTGMTLPFLLVYLHSVRGLSVPVAGAAAASIAAASLAGNPLGGAGSDRIGPRATLAAGLAVAPGPVLAGLTIGQATALLAGLIAACCLAAVLALGLARWLPASANHPWRPVPSPSSLA